MAVLKETYLNKPTTYRVNRVNDEELGVGWQYNYQVVSSLHPEEVGFYLIDGVTSGDEATTWSSQPYTTITFLRNTQTTPFESFNLIATVKIFTDGVEVCETVKIASIIVKPDLTPLTCNGYFSVLPPEDCIFSGEEYIYQYCCSSDIDYVYFTLYNARAYDLTGVEYITLENIKVTATDGCAEIAVVWNENDPTYPGFAISAFAEMSGKFSTVIVEQVDVKPPLPEFDLINPIIDGTRLTGDTLTINYEDEDPPIEIRINKLNRYQLDDIVHVMYRKKYENDDEFREWQFISPSPISIEEIKGADLFIPYEYSFIYLDDHASYIGTEDYVDIEFRVEIYDGLGEYHYHYHVGETCYSTTTKTKKIIFDKCVETIEIGGDAVVGEDTQITIDPCVETIEIGTFVITYLLCVGTTWAYTSPCYWYCLRTLWSWLNPCYWYCQDTTWGYLDPCYTYSTCNRTYWSWVAPCYTLEAGTFTS